MEDYAKCVYFSSSALAKKVLDGGGLLDGVECSSAFHLKGICNQEGR